MFTETFSSRIAPRAKRLEKMTPLRQQYLRIKRKYPEAIVFFRLGDFYETFDEDARIVSRELEIVLSRGPELPEHLAESLVRTVRALRALELKKVPSISESIDWARALLVLGIETLDEATVSQTLGVVLKHASDQAKAAASLNLN